MDFPRHLSRPDGEDSGHSYTTIELIPGEDYLVLVDPDLGDVPDEETVEELQIQAYQRRGTETLGTGEVAVEVLKTLADYAAAGIVGQAALVPFVATARYIQRWRARRRPTLTKEQITPRCEAAVGQIAELPGDPRTISVTQNGDSCWVITLNAAGQQVIVVADPSGTQFSISLRVP